MGKIRVKALGDEALEQEQKKQAKEKRIRLRQERMAEKKVATTEESIPEVAPVVEETSTKPAKKSSYAQKTFTSKKKRSKKYLAVAEKVNENKLYSLSEALDLLPQIHIAKFDETVELHFNLSEGGFSGNATLPHGSGKKVRVVEATDEIISDVMNGKINFDVLVATPAIMPKLARVAKILGPRGLMPNPKNDTVSANIPEIMKKYQGGHVTFKTESKNPIMHVTVGKLSFGSEKLLENIETLLTEIQKTKVKKAVLKSTMSPAITLQLEK